MSGEYPKDQNRQSITLNGKKRSSKQRTNNCFQKDTKKIKFKGTTMKRHFKRSPEYKKKNPKSSGFQKEQEKSSG